MGTGRVAWGNACPKCSDARRQDILDVRKTDAGWSAARLMCVNCEHVWLCVPSNWQIFWSSTMEGEKWWNGEIA